MKYGLPYKGSKNKLAERILALLPNRKNLIDMFCGGCAVSHAALVAHRFGHIHINDINWMCPTLFIDALNGKYNDECRWISREDFFRLRDTDPYVAVVWSFGNNLRDYLYSKEIEPLKKALHYAIFFGDYSLGKDLGYDFSFVEDIGDVSARYAAIKRYFSGRKLESLNRGECSCSQQHKLSGFRLETAERIAHFIKKKKTTAGFRVSSKATALLRLQYRERQSCIAYNIANGSSEWLSCQGGRRLYQAVCLTMPRLTFQVTA